MGLVESLRDDFVAIRRSDDSKLEVLRAIATTVADSPALPGISADLIAEALQKREELGSTGFQNGVAIPHCALEEAQSFAVGCFVYPAGIDFESFDGKPTKVLAFIVGPADKRDEHVRLLASVSRVLNNADIVSELTASSSSTALRESFLRHAAETVETTEQTQRSLFHVFIQREELFPDILQVFSEVNQCSIAVLEAGDASQHLHSMPLFAGFWSSEGKNYHRIVLAVVPRNLSNETLRRLGTVAGDLNSTQGILITIQDLFYCSGSLML